MLNQLSHPGTPTLVIYLFDNSHSDRDEVIIYYGFDWHFPDDEWWWASSYLSVGHLDVFFGRMSICALCLFFSHIFGEVLSYISILHILDINPLSGISFANIFSYAIGCLFVLLMVSFAVQNFLVWSSPNYLFLLLLTAWGDRAKKKKKILLKPRCPRIYCLCFLLGVVRFQTFYLGLQSILS